MLGAFAFVLACVSLLGCTATNAPKGPALIMKELQKEARLIAGGRGYDRTLTQATGSLGNRERKVTEVDLEAGEKYLVVGLCDENCLDIDLEVRDGEGFELASDTLDDAVPIFVVQPDKAGRHLMGTKMIACKSELCIFTVGIYRQ